MTKEEVDEKVERAIRSYCEEHGITDMDSLIRGLMVAGPDLLEQECADMGIPMEDMLRYLSLEEE